MGGLLLALGYDADEAVARRRLERILAETSHVVLVALESPHGIVGIAHAAVRITLVAPPEVELTSIIVSSKHRKSGVGRAMLERVHGWALRRGIDNLITGPQRHRKAALQFFGKMGYTMVAEHRFFHRDLANPTGTGERTAMD